MEFLTYVYYCHGDMATTHRDDMIWNHNKVKDHRQKAAGYSSLGPSRFVYYVLQIIGFYFRAIKPRMHIQVKDFDPR